MSNRRRSATCRDFLPIPFGRVRCIAALWRRSPETQIDHRPDGLRRRPLSAGEVLPVKLLSPPGLVA
jgi:hypothetical protein